jgi:hypothetical protein
MICYEQRSKTRTAVDYQDGKRIFEAIVQKVLRILIKEPTSLVHRSRMLRPLWAAKTANRFSG